MLKIQKFVIPFILSIVFILTIAAPLKLKYKPFNEFPHKTATSNPIEFYSMEAHEQINWDHGMNVFEWVRFFSWFETILLKSDKIGEISV